MMTWKMPQKKQRVLNLLSPVLPINYHYQPINFWLLSTCLDENSLQFDSFLSVCMMVTAYSFVQHNVTHEYSVLTSIMTFNWKQTKTHSENQKEVLELEITLFSTKNACKEWPIGFMIWPIEILRKGPCAHLVKIFPYHCSGQQFLQYQQNKQSPLISTQWT
jgi:hypothetical protein